MGDPKSKIGLEIVPLSDARRKQAEKELRETPERVKEATEALRALLKGDPKLKFRDDDEFLIRFLRPTKFYPESAFALMQRAAEFKEKNASLLDNLKPTDEKVTICDHDVVNVLAGRDQHGRRILFVNAGEKWDPKKVTTDNIFRVFYMVHIGAMMEPETQVTGVVVIMDFLGLSMKQVAGFSPAFSMRLLTFIQDAMPLRLKEVHIVNQPFLFNMVFQMFKPFIREKLKGRLFFHGKKMESLHKHLDPAYLPQDYGGQLPKMNYTSREWYPVIEGITDKIDEWDKMGVVKA
ncbi:retinaldehyde-binding protein 1 [Anabrus simplex]|uniref:retinaldehyde-binding protein 1-like n=1 Tax=Anabrus simplex TaxID=316456 RepID=UPI0035A3A855